MYSFLQPITSRSIIFNNGLQLLDPTTMGANAGRIVRVSDDGLSLEAVSSVATTNLPVLQLDNFDTYANLAAFPPTGASDRFYVATDTGKIYRWSGAAYSYVGGDVYPSSQVDTLLAAKSDTTHNHDATYVKLAGSTMTGALAMGTNNVSGIGTATGTTSTFTNVNGTTGAFTTVNATNVNPTNLGACALAGTLNANSQNVSGVAALSAATLSGSTSVASGTASLVAATGAVVANSARIDNLMSKDGTKTFLSLDAFGNATWQATGNIDFNSKNVQNVKLTTALMCNTQQVQNASRVATASLYEQGNTAKFADLSTGGMYPVLPIYVANTTSWLQLGEGDANRSVAAGVIAYNKFSNGCLDIVGYSANNADNSTRLVRAYDNFQVGANVLVTGGSGLIACTRINPTYIGAHTLAGGLDGGGYTLTNCGDIHGNFIFGGGFCEPTGNRLFESTGTGASLRLQLDQHVAGNSKNIEGLNAANMRFLQDGSGTTAIEMWTGTIWPKQNMDSTGYYRVGAQNSAARELNAGTIQYEPSFNNTAMTIVGRSANSSDVSTRTIALYDVVNVMGSLTTPALTVNGISTRTQQGTFLSATATGTFTVNNVLGNYIHSLEVWRDGGGSLVRCVYPTASKNQSTNVLTVGYDLSGNTNVNVYWTVIY